MTNDIDKYSRENNGLLTYSMLLKHYNKPQIRNYVNDAIISRVAHGIYYYKDYTVDMMRVHQVSNSTIIYFKKLSILSVNSSILYSVL